MKTQIIDETQIDIVVNSLKNNQTIAYKTDTIFGLSCLATSTKACKNLVKIKQRSDKPLIIFVGKKMDINKYVKNIPDKLNNIINKFWPGPLTIIFELNYPFCKHITCNKNTIAIRNPDHDFTQNVLLKLNEPIVTTSANKSGQQNLNNVQDIFNSFNNQISYIIKPNLDNDDTPSTIITCLDNKIEILREGAIKKEQLQPFM